MANQFRQIQISPRTLTFLAPVVAFLGDNVWCAGGALVRMFEGLPSNEADYDLFAVDPAKLHGQLMAAGLGLERESSLSWTFRDNKGNAIQVIRRPYTNLEEVLNSFDFQARMIGTDGVRVVHHEKAIWNIQNKIIKFHPGNFSISVTSLFGIAKYANRGYRLSYTDAREFLGAWGVPLENIPTEY